MVGHLNIAVQQQIVFSINLVVAFSKTPVLIELNDPALFTETGIEQFQRDVGRGIVSHIDRCFITRILQDVWQVLLQHLGTVPVEYDYGKFIHLTIFYLLIVDCQLKCRTVMVEITQPHREYLVVVLLTGIGSRQLHTDVVLGETVHGLAARGLFKQHL